MGLASGLLRVPVFPLAGALLFPRTQLPLHIFEERYKRIRGLIDGRRLGCQAKVAQADVDVWITEESLKAYMDENPDRIFYNLNIDAGANSFFGCKTVTV